MFWIIVIIIVALLLIAVGSTADKTEKQFKDRYQSNLSDLKYSGTYVSGHPSIDDSIKETYLLLGKEDVKIFIGPGNLLKGRVPKESITNVVMEDSSTIQNRVTVGRLLMTGIFAFAWKKKTKQECAYFIIEWDKGQFKNETIFEFEGKGSIQKANALRNKFISYLS